MSLVGKTLGRFRLLEEVGSGGFATVYLGLDTQLNEPVAVKVLLDKASRDPTAVARFEREAQALRKLPTHPNIVGLRASGKVDGYYYLVMDYLAGNDLSTVLSRQGRLPVPDAVDIIAQIADALKAASAAGLVHRDIKPENIRLLPDGTVKLLDFGIARDAATSRLTKEGLLAGTAAYVAPEVWRGQQPDQSSDIYALGCVFYELLTGQPPFVSDSLESTMRLHLESNPDMNVVAAAGAPADVCDAIEQMLRKDARKRPGYDRLLAWLTPYRRGGESAARRYTIPTLTPADAGAAPRRAAGAGRGEPDETRVNLRTESESKAKASRSRPSAFRLQPADDAPNAIAGRRQQAAARITSARAQSRRGGVIALAVILFIMGMAAGALATATLALPAVLDLRASQLAPGPASAARSVANLLRGTPLPQPTRTAPAMAAQVTPPTPTVTVGPVETPGTIFNFIPGRLRRLPDGRRADYWIDDSSPGLTLDPPMDSEAGKITWTRLDYMDAGDYGSGFVTIRAGVTANIIWSMDRPLAPGFYELFIYRPWRPPDPLVRPFIAMTVPYEVRLDGRLLLPFAGSSVIDHQASYGQWVSIGGYELTESGILSVRLDVENALPARYEVAIDGLAIARLGDARLTATQTPAPTATVTPTPDPTAAGQ